MFSKTSLQLTVLLSVLAFFAQASHLKYYAITGTHTGLDSSGVRPARRSILDVQHDIPSWSLYIQALTSMQAMDEEDQSSYFQIAGIHGRPFIPWNNISEVSGPQWGGYCTHTSVLFLTWHRPYLALFEQLLASHVQAVAQTYAATPFASTYQAAANNFRIPYWDWASKSDMPKVVTQQYVQITTASGNQSVENPLYQYKFHTFPLNPEYFPENAGDGNLPNDPYTIRGPTDTVNANLAGQHLMSGTYSAFTKPATFDAFCTTATSGYSLEGLHNTVHAYVGYGEYHMGFLTYAAFDPIFWLHHANVDRLFAMWQCMYPNQYLTAMTEGMGTFAILPGNNDTQSTSLEPFSSDDRGHFYTSASSWKTRTFGYTYPEIQDWNKTSAQLKADVTATFNSLYNPQGHTKRASVPGAQTKEWSVALNVSKYDLQGERFIVRVFLGPIPENPEDWALSSGCMGSFPVFPAPLKGSGPYPTIISFSEIDLTKGLVSNGLDPENVEAVVKWLTSNLNWGVQKFDLTVVPNDKIPSLHVVVQDEDMTSARGRTELPRYGPPNLHPEVTQCK